MGQMFKLVECIRKIISSVPLGKIFDSHDVIRELVVKHRAIYDAHNTYANPRDYNAKISQLISGLSDLVAREMPDKSSPNCTTTCIKGNSTPCARWKRI